MHTKHKEVAPKSICCAVITVSDTRNKQSDKSGKLIIDYLEQAKHEVSYYDVVPDEAETIKETVEGLGETNDSEVIILSGGTGIAQRDVTIEAVEPMFSKEITGLGELFRMLSYQEDIGSASMLSRATCGTIQHRLVFIIPGSTGAVKLAMEKLIIPELPHAVGELKKNLS